MSRILTDSALRSEIITHGYEFAKQQFSPDVLAAKLMSIYKKLQ